MYKTFKYRDDIQVKYSIVTPIYNQEDIIVENLMSVIENTLGTFEIILILDFCFDKTEEMLLSFLEKYIPTNLGLTQIKIFKNSEKPMFETKCDNIGFKESKGEYCLEIQADMKMTEKGYNLQLTKPFIKLKNVIAVSGRCAHNLFNGSGIGKLGGSVEKTISELGIEKNKFYSFETCNRGPLLLDKSKLIELNYLNEEEYFLDNSDHDLMARAYLEKGYICGYVPIDFYAPLVNGSTRSCKNYNNSKEYLINKQEKDLLQQKTSELPGLSKYIQIWKSRQPIVYIL